MLDGAVDERRRLVQQRRRRRVRADVDRRVGGAQAGDAPDQLVAVGGPQHPELGRREAARLALVHRALPVVAELLGADQRGVRERLVQPPSRRPAGRGGRRRSATRRRRAAPSASRRPARRQGEVGGVGRRPSSGRSAGRSPSRTAACPVALRTTSGASTIATVSGVDHAAIHAATSSTPRAQPASTIVAVVFDGDEPGLVGRLRPGVPRPRPGRRRGPGWRRQPVRPGRARPRRRRTRSSVRIASSTPVGGTPRTQRVKPSSA